MNMNFHAKMVKGGKKSMAGPLDWQAFNKESIVGGGGVGPTLKGDDQSCAYNRDTSKFNFQWVFFNQI